MTQQILSRRRLMATAGLASAAALCAPGLIGRASAATSFRIAVADPIGSSVGQAATELAERVAEHTGGEITLQVFPDGVLYGRDQNAAVNQLSGGSLDALILASSVYASFEPRMNAISLPYLFQNYDQLQSYLNGEPGQALLGDLERLNIEGVGFFLRTFRNVTTRETPITRVEDFQGLTLRTPNNPLFVRLFEELGANPTPMAFSEVYTALQLRAIDGQENPVEVPFNNRFYEVQNHLNMTQHLADSYVVGFSQAAWQRVPEEHREGVRAAAAEMIESRNAAEIAQEAEIIEELQELGMQVNEFEAGELERTQEIARGIYPEFEEIIGSDFVQMSLEHVGA
jgi:TRAP-type transport system periplasmic protein